MRALRFDELIHVSGGGGNNGNNGNNGRDGGQGHRGKKDDQMKQRHDCCCD